MCCPSVQFTRPLTHRPFGLLCVSTGGGQVRAHPPRVLLQWEAPAPASHAAAAADAAESAAAAAAVFPAAVLQPVPSAVSHPRWPIHGSLRQKPTMASRSTSG